MTTSPPLSSYSLKKAIPNRTSSIHETVQKYPVLALALYTTGAVAAVPVAVFGVFLAATIITVALISIAAVGAAAALGATILSFFVSISAGFSVFVSLGVVSACYAARTTSKYLRQSYSKNENVQVFASALENADAWVWDTLDQTRERTFGSVAIKQE